MSTTRIHPGIHRHEIQIKVILYDRHSACTSEHATAGFLDERGCYDSFIWEEGNYSCDCNRYLFFARGKGRDDPPEQLLVCNRGRDDQRFAILAIVDADNGELLYTEIGDLS